MDEQTIRRFLSRVAPQPDGCWFWTGGRTSKGYGAFYWCGMNRPAHRFAYELWVGPIPEGLEIDHTCCVLHCVAPAHLEAVTHAENMRRGPTNLAGQRAKQTHCKSGHPLTGDNLYVYRNMRYCRKCRVQRQMEYERRKRAS